MNASSSRAQRQAFLHRYFRELEDWRAGDFRECENPDIGPTTLDSRQRQERRLMRWRQSYESGLPVVALARSPFSGQLFESPFDPFGLDGLWWNFEAPVRPYREAPETFFALTGAVTLEEPVESAPFLCKPGPAVPYLLPRLLEHPFIKAVIAETSVGRHRAFAVVYFAQLPLPNVPRANEWGSDSYLRVSPDGGVGWSSVQEDPGEFDFDIAAWIERRKVLWIAPNDDNFTLQTGIEGCPYLRLPGTRASQRIENGTVWSHNSLDETIA